MTAAELAEKLDALAFHGESGEFPPAINADLRQAAARLRSMEEALENIDAAAPFVPPHPSESEYDFGSQYFNTSDDYALHRANRDASRIGDIARAAISGEGQ